MVNPVMTGREMKSVIHPKRSAPASVSSSPALMATAADTAVARTGSPEPTTPKTTAPDMIATVEVGPTETCRDEPKIAYRISAAGAAYSPTWTGTSATVE